MSADQKFQIDINDNFPNLLHAPIVEAVIEVLARAEGAWDETGMRSYFEPILSGYSFLDAQKVVEAQVEMQAGQAPKQLVKDLGLKGVRFRSSDKRHIVQLNRDGLVFSRLQPYEDWDQLSSEAMRLWRIYLQFAQVGEIQRVGVRFINRIQLPPEEIQFEDYIQPAPQPPQGIELPFTGFMHYDTLTIPPYSYAINVIRTIQQPVDLQRQGLALILDITAFTTKPFELVEGAIEQRLLEMRWLKNKVFFGSITEKALKGFQ